MSDLPPPPAPSGGWPQQPGPGPQPGYRPGPQPYGAPPRPGPGGPYGSPYGYGPTGGGYELPKAGFGSRLGAYLIDGLILTLFFVPMFVAFVTGETEWKPCRLNEDNERVDDGGPNNGLCEQPTGATVALGGGLALLGLAGVLVYYGRLEGRSGQTVGARAAGIRVVDIQTGQPIGSGRAIGRWFARILSAIPCYLGYFWMLWDDQKQTWHDKMTSSVVVRT